MYRFSYIVLFLCFNASLSVNAQTEKVDTGRVEVKAKRVDDSFNNGTSLIRINFYRTIPKKEKLGLMAVRIDSTIYLTELDGDLKKRLTYGRTYDIDFIGAGYFYPQKKSIKIEKNCEYRITVYVVGRQSGIVE